MLNLLYEVLVVKVIIFVLKYINGYIFRFISVAKTESPFAADAVKEPEGESANTGADQASNDQDQDFSEMETSDEKQVPENSVKSESSGEKSDISEEKSNEIEQQDSADENSNKTQPENNSDNWHMKILNAEIVDVETLEDSSQGPVVALSLGLAITLLMLIFVGCRLRTVKRRLRKGRALHSNEADYLINGMYL